MWVLLSLFRKRFLSQIWLQLIYVAFELALGTSNAINRTLTDAIFLKIVQQHYIGEVSKSLTFMFKVRVGRPSKQSSLSVMLENLQWLTLEHCRKNQRLTTMFKIVHGLMAVPTSSLTQRIRELNVSTRTSSNASWRPQLHTKIPFPPNNPPVERPEQRNRRGDYHQLLQASSAVRRRHSSTSYPVFESLLTTFQIQVQMWYILSNIVRALYCRNRSTCTRYSKINQRLFFDSLCTLHLVPSRVGSAFQQSFRHQLMHDSDYAFHAIAYCVEIAQQYSSLGLGVYTQEAFCVCELNFVADILSCRNIPSFTSPKRDSNFQVSIHRSVQ